MHVLVTGASGYLGGLLVPRLLLEGHRVRAAARRPESLVERDWHDQVDTVRYEASDPDLTAAAVEDVDAVLYLVHGLEGTDFADRDRVAAGVMAQACTDGGVGRIVYVSGLVPLEPDRDLSDHLSSRLEVEEVLGTSSASTITLRAAIVLGAGSTSFELMGQISRRFPVQALPRLASSRVQPVAQDDLLEAVVGALVVDSPTRPYDVAGPEVLTYGDLLGTYTSAAGLLRPRVPAPLLPTDLVGLVAGQVSSLPSATVRALVESMSHDMVAREDDFVTDLLPEDHRLLDVREALERAGVGRR